MKNISEYPGGIWPIDFEFHPRNALEGIQTDRLSAYPSPGQITFLRTLVVCKLRGRSRSSHYSDIKAGLFVKPVLIGQRAKGTPDIEVKILISARIAGKPDSEIRALVVKLEAARQTIG